MHSLTEQHNDDRSSQKFASSKNSNRPLAAFFNPLGPKARKATKHAPEGDSVPNMADLEQDPQGVIDQNMPEQMQMQFDEPESTAAPLDPQPEEYTRRTEWAICTTCGLRHVNPSYACPRCFTVNLRLCPPPGEPIDSMAITKCQTVIASNGKCEWRLYSSTENPNVTQERYVCGTDSWNNGKTVTEKCSTCPWQNEPTERTTSALTNERP